MTPAPTPSAIRTSSSGDQPQSPRMTQRRNAMADVMAGMSAEEINMIRVNAPATIGTGCLTCVSTVNASSSSSNSSSGRRSTSNSSFSDMDSEGSTAEMAAEGANASELAAMAYRASIPPMTSPSMKHRRNGVPNVLAHVDEDTLRRIRTQANDSQRLPASHGTHDFFCF